MMLTLCVVHSHIVSTHSGPTIGDGQNKQKIVRRLRHTRCRMGKSRTRQNLRKFLIIYCRIILYNYYVCGFLF